MRVSLATLQCIRDGLCYTPTAYILLPSSSGCLASCRYCTQSRTSRCAKHLLSRITWPTISMRELVEHLDLFRHVCIQGVLKPGFAWEILGIAKAIRRGGFNGTISTTINPVGRSLVERLADHIDYIGIGLDACSPRVFKAMLKPYTWRAYIEFARTCRRVLGEGMVSVHVVIGLGETAEEYASLADAIYSMGCRAALFAYTPLDCLAYRGPRPSLHYYRWCQLYRELLEQGYEPRLYLDPGRVCVVADPPWRVYVHAFLTSGCPHCTRPFYNEGPRDPVPYNYPATEPLQNPKSDAGVLRRCSAPYSSRQGTTSRQ